MMRGAPLLFLFLSVGVAYGQNIAAYTNYLEQLYVFDSGAFIKLEALPPRGMTIGGNYLAYAASNGDLKIYSAGRDTTIESNIATLPKATDHYFGFTMAGALKVYDGQDLKTLCVTTGGSVIEDSLVAWYDNRLGLFNIYYDGVVQVVEDGLANDPVSSWKSGDNVLAWVTQPAGKFKAFYQGEVYELAMMAKDVKYEAGLDVIAYEDPSTSTFKAFYRGEVLDVEAIMPESYQVGKGIIAYVDATGALKVFSNGKVQTASDFAPSEYHVKDSLVVFNDQGFMKVFSNGQVYTVVPYWPAMWSASWGSLAYVDNDLNVQVWWKGNSTLALRKEPIKGLTMDRGLLLIELQLSKVKVWWQGKVYQEEE